MENIYESEFQREKYIGEVAVLRREEQRGAFETTKYCFFLCAFFWSVFILSSVEV
jgi:hypothetical protein